MDRYSRQLVFPAIGVDGQARLLQSRVVIVGCGATGGAIAGLLARAGIGWLRVVDRDFVEWSNLQRQTLFEEADAEESLPKAVAAEARLRRINSEIEVEGRVADLSPATVDDLLDAADLVMDGTDNLEARYLINDACVRDGRPWVYSGAVASYGMVMPIRPGVTACFRCLFPEPARGGLATCDTAGVLGPAITAVASLAAAEALKILLGHDQSLTPGVTHLDVWENSHTVTRVRRRASEPVCPCCVRREFPYLEAAAGSHSVALCGRDAVQVSPSRPAALDLEELAARLALLGDVRRTPHLLKARIEGREITLFPDGRAIIYGIGDPALARSFYARYVGG
jgi:molybdopterin/thiamine biosynthesis adenylyltransferase